MTNASDWNRPRPWCAEYDFDLNRFTYFAEDLFGGQCAIASDGVYRFDPETAVCECMCESIAEWCGTVLDDSGALTAHPLATQWMQVNGPIAPGHRLVPIVPFVCQGEHAIQNLACMRDAAGMAARVALRVKPWRTFQARVAVNHPSRVMSGLVPRTMPSSMLGAPKRIRTNPKPRITNARLRERTMLATRAQKSTSQGMFTNGM